MTPPSSTSPQPPPPSSSPREGRGTTIRRIRYTEVKVPAKPDSINHASLDRPLHKLPIAGSAGWSVQFDQVPKVIVELELDSGVVGLGECYRGHQWATLEGVAKRLVGTDLRDIPLQLVPIARCRERDGIECAIWDAFARHYGLPLCDLLGGAVRQKVPVSAWTGHRLPEEIGPMARSFQERGYDCWKFKCDLADDVAAWCDAVAEHAPGMRVVLDPNERWERPDEARRRLRRLAACDNLLCLEDPLPRWMLHEYAALRGNSNCAIVLHISLPYIEHGQRVHQAIEALRLDAVDGFNFNGGLTEFAQLDRIAHAAMLPCWHGSEVDLGILEAMYVHQAAAAPSCIWPSDIFGRLVREHDLLAVPLDLVPPHVNLPTGPGLGVDLDREAVKHYQTDQREYA